MASALELEVPDFDKIRSESGVMTEGAMRLLWLVLNNEISARKKGVRIAQERLRGKAISTAPSAQVDDFDAERALVVYFNGSTAVDFTGVANGLEGDVIIFFNIGAGTITFKDEASSAATNQIITRSGGDITVATDQHTILFYINSRWRQANEA